MTREEINVLNYEDLDKRSAEIATETAEADMEKLTALNDELDAISERRAQIDMEVETRNKAAAAVAKGAGSTIEERKEEVKTMTRDEVRNSREYIEAYAKFVKTGKDLECRALLTENGISGDAYVPVPAFVESMIRSAWENDKVFSRVTKSYVPGNLKVGFEMSATDADVHPEGGPDIDEEELVLGIVTLVPYNIKKWITVSDEALALGAEDFLNYLYDEITYKIIQYAANVIVGVIQGAPKPDDPDLDGTLVPVPRVEDVVSAASIITAIGKLGDQAQNPVIIASGDTIASVRVEALNANYAYDPFAGLEVIQKEGVTGAIVGDLAGVLCNMPEGDGVKFIFDNLSLAEKDLVKIVGRMYCAIDITTPGMFVNITGESA